MGPAPWLTMPANSETSMKRNAAPSAKVSAAKIRKRLGFRHSTASAPSPHGVAREQQAEGLDEHIAEIEQLAPGRSAGGVARQDRIGGKQSRKHHDVAQDEEPEPVGDDDAHRVPARRRPPVRARLRRRCL